MNKVADSAALTSQRTTKKTVVHRAKTFRFRMHDEALEPPVKRSRPSSSLQHTTAAAPARTSLSHPHSTTAVRLVKDGNVDDATMSLGVALPNRYQTLEKVRKAVRSPPCRVDFVASSEDCEGLLLCIPDFFAYMDGDYGGSDHYRLRTDPCQRAAIPNGAVKGTGRKRAKPPCDLALHRVLRDAVHGFRDSMGSVDLIDPLNATLIAIVRLSPSPSLTAAHETDSPDARMHSSTRRVNARRQKRFRHGCHASAERPPRVVAVCIATAQERVFRAHVEAPSASPPLPRQSEFLSSHVSESAGGASSGPRDRVSTSAARPVSHIGDVWCSGTTFCGIQFFAVAEAVQRQGLARALVEAARHTVCYGYEVPVEHVAFSEPTAMGSAFARRYSGRTDFLVY